MNELNDYELLEYISSNNEVAYNLMFEKYKPLINKYVKKYLKIGISYGFDKNDLFQEGLIGLNSAILFYNQNKNVKFITLVSTCVERKILSALKKENTFKRKILNESISIDNDDYNLENFLSKNDNDPLDIVSNDIYIDNISKNIKLSKFENEILKLKIKNYSIEEISNKLNVSISKVNNALSRIKSKYKKNKL